MKIKTIITTMIAATLLMSCGNSAQTKTEQSQSTTVEVVNDTIVLTTSNIDYNFNYHEDIGNVTKKLKKTFVLKDSAKVDDWHNYIKKDYIVGHHYAFVKQNDSISVKYHIINGDEHKDWFAYLTVVISSTKPNAFDILQPIIREFGIRKYL